MSQHIWLLSEGYAFEGMTPIRAYTSASAARAAGEDKAREISAAIGATKIERDFEEDDTFFQWAFYSPSVVTEGEVLQWAEYVSVNRLDLH